MHHANQALPTARRLAAIAVAALLFAATPARTADAQFAFNTNLTPTPLAFGLAGIAWQITPAATTTVGGIRTWFSNAVGADRDVTFEIRGANVNGPALRSVTFGSAVARNGLGGADFTEIDLFAGQNYWLTFLGIRGLGRNVNEAPPAGATILPVRILPPTGTSFVPAPIAGSAPILQLQVVPEPTTVTLMVGGLLALAGFARGRRALLH